MLAAWLMSPPHKAPTVFQLACANSPDRPILQARATPARGGCWRWQRRFGWCLPIGYRRSLPSNSGGSVHSPRDRCAARADATAANRKTQHGRRVKSLLSRHRGDTNNQPKVPCADRPGPLGWFQERCGLQTRLPGGPPPSPKHASRAH
jgi:hypothetical protein